MKCILNYRVCEFRPSAPNCIVCVATFESILDVVSYHLLNRFALPVYVRLESGRLVKVSHSTLLETVNDNIDYYHQRFDSVRVSAYISYLSGDVDNVEKL